MSVYPHQLGLMMFDLLISFLALTPVLNFSVNLLMVLGIIGEYLGKIILILNNAPQYIVRETINAEGGAPAAVIKELIRAGREACPDSESKRNTGSEISNTDSEAKGNTDCGIKSNTDSEAKSKPDRGADV